MKATIFLLFILCTNSQDFGDFVDAFVDFGNSIGSIGSNFASTYPDFISGFSGLDYTQFDSYPQAFGIAANNLGDFARNTAIFGRDSINAFRVLNNDLGGIFGSVPILGLYTDPIFDANNQFLRELRRFPLTIANPTRQQLRDFGNFDFSQNQFQQNQNFQDAFQTANETLFSGFQQLPTAFADANQEFYSRWGGFDSSSGVPSGFFAV